jgi:membrane protein required for colicin V production
MVAVDYLIIAIVVLSAIVGLIRGFLREAIAVATWIIAIWGAWAFAGTVEPYLGGALANSPFRPWAARVIVFVLLLLAGSAIGAIVSHFVRLSIFSGTDRFLGLLFGLLRGVVILGAFVIAVQALRLDQEPAWQQSRLLPYAERVAQVLRGLVGERLERIELPPKAAST